MTTGCIRFSKVGGGQGDVPPGGFSVPDPPLVLNFITKNFYIPLDEFSYPGILAQITLDVPTLAQCITRHNHRQVGSPLYLTPMIDAGDIANAQNMARVVDPLDGIEPGQQPESYSGFITVNETTGSHMFFWFFPCNESAISRDAAPVSIWLNGGPGASSLFGLLELHGPLRAVFNGTGNDTIAELNPWSWYNRASIIYIDNPVGTGYSHTLPEGFVTTQEEVGVDLYEFLTQFFTLFPEYADNDFYAFGESYAGKYIPVISKKIHDENQNNPDVRIQLKGIGIGNGFISPYDQAIYSTYLHELSFLDELMLEEGLRREQLLRDAIDDGNYTLAWAVS